MLTDNVAVDPPNDGRDLKKSTTTSMYCRYCSKSINLTRGSEISWRNHVGSGEHKDNERAFKATKLTAFFQKTAARPKTTQPIVPQNTPLLTIVALDDTDSFTVDSGLVEDFSNATQASDNSTLTVLNLL